MYAIAISRFEQKSTVEIRFGIQSKFNSKEIKEKRIDSIY